MPNFWSRGAARRARRGRAACARRTAAGLGTAALLAGTVAGCGPAGPATGVAAPVPGQADDRPVVVATFTVIADLAAAVGGDEVQVQSVTDPGAEVHGYEPSPDDLRRAAGADLILANGLGLEAWLDGLLAPLDVPRLVLGDAVDPLPVDPADPDGPLNPHVWMSPSGGQAYVHAVADAFAELDPAHAATFRSRARAYAARLEELRGELRDRLATVPPERRLLVTCEGAFGYLARDAGLDEAYLWPVNAERQGTPRQVARVIRTVREREVPAVFCESTVAATAQEQVARETGARFGGTLYVDSLSGPDGPVPTYLDLLRHDVDVVVEGLTR